MELDWIWQTILIFIIGKMVLRLGGRKSISQMTITQVIVMVGIGSLLIQPVSGRGLSITFAVAFLITILMIVTEYIELKIDFLETIFTGKSVIVIKNGKPVIKNLKKLRLTIDRLETRLRQSGISSIEDIKYATMEVSGQLGYELKDSKKPITREDYMNFMTEIGQIKNILSSYSKMQRDESQKNNIFEEIKTDKFEGNKKEP